MSQLPTHGVTPYGPGGSGMPGVANNSIATLERLANTGLSIFKGYQDIKLESKLDSLRIAAARRNIVDPPPVIPGERDQEATATAAAADRTRNALLIGGAIVLGIVAFAALR